VTTGRVIARLAGKAGAAANAAAGRLLARAGSLPRPGAWLAGEVENQTDRWPLWLPVAFGGGCAAYFALKTEPAAWHVYVAAAVTAAAAWIARKRSPSWLIAALAALIFAFAAGLAVAKLRTDRVAAPVAPANLGVVTVQGWVLDSAGTGASGGGRVVIAPTSVSRLRPEETPIRIRATFRGEAPRPGEAVRFRALLNPPPPPAAPGAYDFARDAFYYSVGGVAFVLGDVRPADLGPAPDALRRKMAVNAFRWRLAERLYESMSPRAGAIAAALVTDHETFIGREDLDAMRDSGLAHLLSISGLHMAIVGGFVFFGTRLAIAAWPWLALRVDGKRLAAAAGLAAVGGYLIVSGGPPPAVRAAVTASIAFAAILVGRRAISLEALAVAALIVLFVQPEAVVQPGFQMSFAATAALVAMAEAWPRQPKEISVPHPIAAVQRARDWLVASGAVSLVAGLATGPFAIQHFNRVAMYGLPANLLSSPLSSFVVMPALAVGSVLEGLGLGAPFLWLAEQGLDATLAVAHWAQDMPGSIRIVPSAPSVALAVAFVGLLFVCLWRGRLRWLGLPFACAVTLCPRPEPPVAWIAADGTNAAIVVDGRALVLRPEIKRFAVDLWLRRRGVEEGSSEGRFDCGRFYCRTASDADHLRVALWWGRSAPDGRALATLCRGTDLAVIRAELRRAPPAACDSTRMVDGREVAKGGAAELFEDGDGWRLVWSAKARGDRPWTQGARP
jgi:competence protein ComEC